MYRHIGDKCAARGWSVGVADTGHWQLCDRFPLIIALDSLHVWKQTVHNAAITQRLTVKSSHSQLVTHTIQLTVNSSHHTCRLLTE